MSKPLFDEQSDNSVRAIFGKNRIGFYENKTDVFFHSNLEHQLKRSAGYKLHVNVSEQDILQFLKDAVPKLESEGVAFKIWKPSMLSMISSDDDQRGKLLTIYAQSRWEAIKTISELKPILSKYRSGVLPPYETRLNDFMSYRYSSFQDQTLINPWNSDEKIGSYESRTGVAVAWARGLELKDAPRLVSRSEVEAGNAKLGDLVAVRVGGLKGYVAAELLDYRAYRGARSVSENKFVCLTVRMGRKLQVFEDIPLGAISQTPSEALTRASAHTV